MQPKTDDEKTEIENQERFQAWSKLRIIPEYIRDYKISLNPHLSAEEQKRMNETWGFWPLSNPDENFEFEFLCAFSSYNEDVSRFSASIIWNGLEHFNANKGKLYNPNNRFVKKVENMDPIIQLEVDLRTPISVLVQEFKEGLEHFKGMLDIKTSNSRTHDHLEYLTNCLLKAGLKETEIIDRLLSFNDKTKPYDDETRLSSIEKIRRRIKKHKKVQT